MSDSARNSMQRDLHSVENVDVIQRPHCGFHNQFRWNIL